MENANSMEASDRLTQRCASCGEEHEIEFSHSVNGTRRPELREKIASGEYFVWECPHCGARNLIREPFLFHDEKERLMILLTEADVKSEGLPEGYTGRLVHSAGELVEKIKIFDAGLDDAAVELCKYITSREMKLDVPLRFVSAGGPDSEIIFTYPKESRMEMIATGFNVYEDCAGILRRNQDMVHATEGLACVDSNWLARFIA